MVWFSHKKGLSSININTFQFRNFNIMDGLQGYEFSENTGYVSKATGQTLFWWSKWNECFFPGQRKGKHSKPKVAFTQLSVMQELITPNKNC